MLALEVQLKFELNRFSAQEKSIESLFIGGGTPSTVSPKLYEPIFKILKPYLQNNIEITSEANPNSASYEWLEGMKMLGVNRISFGVQSFNEKKLKLLNRAHTPQNAVDAVNNAHKIGYKNLSIDLIYATLGDTKELLLHDITTAKSLPINHISAYALTIEEGTPFASKPQMSKETLELTSWLFEELEKEELQALPANRYIYEQYKRAKVNIDYHIVLEKCYYSVPFKFLQKEVEVRYSGHHVRIYYNNEIIATHPRLRTVGMFSTLSEHRTPDHAYIHDKWNPQRFDSWASSIGEYSTKFVTNALERADYPEQAYRRILAVLKLAKDYGYTEFELALMYALEHNTTTTKSIKSILDKRLYLQSSSSNNHSYSTPNLFNTHSNIRGADEYQ